MTTEDERRFAAGVIAEDPPQVGARALIEAMRDGLVDCTCIEEPRAKWPSARVDGVKLPLLIILANSAPSLGPSGWRTAQRLRVWCVGALVREDTEPTPQETRRLIEAIRQAGRLALIETTGELLPEWRAWFGAKLACLTNQGFRNLGTGR